jgi:hypothetical protein
MAGWFDVWRRNGLTSSVLADDDDDNNALVTSIRILFEEYEKIVLFGVSYAKGEKYL